MLQQLGRELYTHVVGFSDGAALYDLRGRAGLVVLLKLIVYLPILTIVYPPSLSLSAVHLQTNH